MNQTNSIMEKILVSSPICSVCGKEKEPQILETPFGTRTVFPVSSCERQTEEKAAFEKEKIERKRKLDSMFKQSRLGARFKNSSFENFVTRNGTEEAYNASIDYVKNFNDYKRAGKGLLFSSIPGTGKTHLISAITNELVNKLYSVVFIVVPDLLMQLMNSYDWSNSESEQKIMHGLAECDLLILDDIGAENTKDWAREKLFTVINRRYGNNQPIIFSTNLNSTELRERFGSRTFSRMMQVSKPIKLTCDDYRLKGY